MDAQDKPIALILVKRAAIFAFAICAVSAFYWVVGSASSFLDETQSMLLEVMRLSSLGIVAFSGLGAALTLAFAVSGRRRPGLAGFLGYVLTAASGLAALYVAETVEVLSRGIR
jgi:hypothetical protein